MTDTTPPRHTLGHLSFGVRDLERTARIYDTVLTRLGYQRVWASARAVGFGAFHRAALAAGGHCAGAPGPRPQYGNSYFAAFVIDPDDHKLEAVHQ